MNIYIILERTFSNAINIFQAQGDASIEYLPAGWIQRRGSNAHSSMSTAEFLCDIAAMPAVEKNATSRCDTSENRIIICFAYAQQKPNRHDALVSLR